MLIDFGAHRQKQLERMAYRQSLVDHILDHYRKYGGEDLAHSFYLEHVKRGFPISILENIVSRLNESQASCS